MSADTSLPNGDARTAIEAEYDHDYVRPGQEYSLADDNSGSSCSSGCTMDW